MFPGHVPPGYPPSVRPIDYVLKSFFVSLIGEIFETLFGEDELQVFENVGGYPLA